MPDAYEAAHACLNAAVNDAALDPGRRYRHQPRASTAPAPNPCAADTDGDGFKDKPATLHLAVNADTSVDNCPLVANPGQQNSDAAIDNGPDIVAPDVTVAHSDALGDACDPDIDNDGLPNAQDIEPLGATGVCAAFAGATDGHPFPAGGDITADDNANGDSAPPLGTDAADNGPSWDTDNDGVLDGVECLLGTNPRNAASRPSHRTVRRRRRRRRRRTAGGSGNVQVGYLRRRARTATAMARPTASRSTTSTATALRTSPATAIKIANRAPPAAPHDRSTSISTAMAS